MTRPFLDVVGITLASLAAGIIVLLAMVFGSAQLDVESDKLAGAAISATMLSGYLTWRWLLSRHKRRLEAYKSELSKSENSKAQA